MTDRWADGWTDWQCRSQLYASAPSLKKLKQQSDLYNTNKWTIKLFLQPHVSVQELAMYQELILCRKHNAKI